MNFTHATHFITLIELKTVDKQENVEISLKLSVKLILENSAKDSRARNKRQLF